MPPRRKMLPDCIPEAHKDLVFYPMKPSPCVVLPYTFKKWVWEPKHDGWHVLFVITPNLIGAYSRRLKRVMNDWVGLQPVFEELSHIKQPTIILGELMAQSGIRTDVPRLKKNGVAFPKFFDIINENIGDKPLSERRKVLEDSGLPQDWIVRQEIIGSRNNLEAQFKIHKTQKGCEGLVIKDPVSRYHQSQSIGVMTNQWLKIK